MDLSEGRKSQGTHRCNRGVECESAIRHGKDKIKANAVKRAGHVCAECQRAGKH